LEPAALTVRPIEYSIYGKQPSKPIPIVQEDPAVIANEITIVGLRLFKEIPARDMVSSFEEIEVWLSTLLKPGKGAESAFLDDLVLQNILTKVEGTILLLSSIACGSIILFLCFAEKIAAGSVRFAHSFETYLLYYYRIRDWITHEIVDSPGPKERAAKIAHFIHVTMVRFQFSTRFPQASFHLTF